MKILFLQLWYDLYGGVETVNDTLANQFVKDGLDVSILCLWSKGNGEYINNGNYPKLFIDKEPIRASYKKMLRNILNLNFKTFIPDLKKSLKYYKLKRQNRKDFAQKICEINPDFIIIGNMELIEFVPKKYLNKTVIEMHSGIQFYYKNKKMTNVALKYSNKVKKIIFLTKNFVDEAKKLGFCNTIYINNPVRIKSDKVNNLKQKNISFIGRIAPEKRVDKLVDIFNESELYKQGWNLNIYGTGDTSNLNIKENIHIKGGTDDVKKTLEKTSILALTSEYEGFPMVILEAYACGVPVIVYDYGISSEELIINNKTGFIIPQNDKGSYIEKLKYLCNDENVRRKMGQEAKKVIEKYYPENIVKQWYKLFRGEL